jgi:hypothetical protein
MFSRWPHHHLPFCVEDRCCEDKSVVQEQEKISERQRGERENRGGESRPRQGRYERLANRADSCSAGGRRMTSTNIHFRGKGATAASAASTSQEIMIGSAPSCAMDIQKFRTLSYYRRMGLEPLEPQALATLMDSVINRHLLQLNPISSHSVENDKVCM